MTPRSRDEMVLDILDHIAEVFKRKRQESLTEHVTDSGEHEEASHDAYDDAYRYTRTVAHRHGIHLTSCREGRRTGDTSGRDWNDEDTS